MNNKLLLIGCLIFLSLFYAQASLTAEQIPDKNPEINIEDSDLLSNLSKLEKDSWEATKKHDTDFFAPTWLMSSKVSLQTVLVLIELTSFATWMIFN